MANLVLCVCVLGGLLEIQVKLEEKELLRKPVMFFLSWCRTARQKVYFPKIVFHLLSAEDRSLRTGRVAGNGFPYLTFDSPVSASQPSARITHPWEVVCFSLLIIWENINSILLIIPYNHQERLYFFSLQKQRARDSQKWISVG